jgi:arsenate reductase
MTARQALRTSKTPAIETGLAEVGVRDNDIITAMLAHPILVNRPIVATRKGVGLCRPSETVLDLLDRLPHGPFYPKPLRACRKPSAIKVVR